MTTKYYQTIIIGLCIWAIAAILTSNTIDELLETMLIFYGSLVLCVIAYLIHTHEKRE